MSANVDTAIAGTTRCVSCDAPLAGPYCSRCGERTLEPEALTLRHFVVHTVAHELLHVDGALWRTLRLLFVRPGQLSLEYAAGRRRPYVNPFRLLLIAIVAYVLISSSGLIVTWNFGPVTMSIAPRRSGRAFARLVPNTPEALLDRTRFGSDRFLTNFQRRGMLMYDRLVDIFRTLFRPLCLSRAARIGSFG